MLQYRKSACFVEGVVRIQWRRCEIPVALLNRQPLLFCMRGLERHMEGARQVPTQSMPVILIGRNCLCISASPSSV